MTIDPNNIVPYASGIATPGTLVFSGVEKDVDCGLCSSSGISGGDVKSPETPFNNKKLPI